MNLSLPLILMLSQHCAPDIAPETLISVAHVESRFDPLTIGVNGQRPRTLHPSTKAEAVRQAGALIASGVSVDLGLGQINSRNLGWLGLSLEDAFDPCRNLAAAAKVLASNYAAAAPGQDAQAALRVAFSKYNTGDPGSITTIHADSAALAFEQLTLLVRESEGGRDLPRDDIRDLLHLLVDVVVQMKKTDGRFRMTEVYYDPLRKRRPGH